MGSNTRTNIALAVLWAAILGATLYVAIQGLSVVLDATARIITAIITGLFVLIGAYVTHVLTTQRERETEQLRQKQERYASILDGLVSYIRNKGEDSDSFAMAVLHAYVVGDESVAEAIRKFTKDRTSQNLDQIVLSMRKDLGMEPLKDLEVEELRKESQTDAAWTSGLLPPPKKDASGTI